MMNGIEFLRSLRQDPALRSQIVFVLTSSNLEMDKQAAYDYQVAGYLLKGELSTKWPLFLQLLDIYRGVVEFPPDHRPT
jgi:CheY-like chemotaxis protein